MTAPEPILKASLRVLFIAGCYTRNWTLSDKVPRKQINDPWEAIHEIPDLLTRWTPEAEIELREYLEEYNQKWESPELTTIFENTLKL